jgi:hypothetical protein
MPWELYAFSVNDGFAIVCEDGERWYQIEPPYSHQRRIENVLNVGLVVEHMQIPLRREMFPSFADLVVACNKERWDRLCPDGEAKVLEAASEILLDLTADELEAHVVAVENAVGIAKPEHIKRTALALWKVPAMASRSDLIVRLGLIILKVLA